MKEFNKKKLPLVSIEWVDAEGDISWNTADEIEEWGKEDCIIYEIGWIVHQTKKYIIITNQLTYNGDIGNRTKIPIKWVKKMRTVSLKNIK